MAQTLLTDGSEDFRLRALVSPHERFELAFEGRPGGWVSGWEPSFRIRATSLDRRRFYGYGNATTSTLPSSAYEVWPFEVTLQTGLSYESPRLRARFGPEFRHTETHLDLDEEDEGTAATPTIFETRPYGVGSFSQVGVFGEVEYRTDSPWTGARSGVGFGLEGRWSPFALDVDASYGVITGYADAFVRPDLPLAPIFAIRAGFQRSSANAPYFDAAYLGGFERLRGSRSQRYAGNGAVWAGVENRLRFATATVLGTGVELGTTVFADVGRLSFEGDTSSPLRAGYGGGLWIAAEGGPSLSFTAANAGDETRLFLRFGLFGWD